MSGLLRDLRARVLAGLCLSGVLGAIPHQAGEAQASPGVRQGLDGPTIAAWQRVASCETGATWSGLGATYQGGLGIWYGNWDRWARHFGLSGRYPDAGDAPAIVQIRLADWAYRHESPRPYWGCFATVGRP